MLANLTAQFDSLVEVGLGYLALDRESGTLSGGEAQRVKMVGHLGSALTDVTYVFDEPTVGLHPHDIDRMVGLLQRIRDKGNTVLVVEHKPQVIEQADHIVDVGPGAGRDGGQITYAGDLAGLKASDSVTGSLLGSRPTLVKPERRPTGVLRIRGAATHNLKNVDVDVPLGLLTAVTGVAGSGKSSLIHGSIADGSMAQAGDIRVVDQSAIRGSIRSNPATYTGLLDPIRTAFAKANKVKPALFSANSAGACPNCKGLGIVYTDLGMMAGVSSVCDHCEGKRFTGEVLQYRLHGLTIADVLNLSIAQASDVFTTGNPAKILGRLRDVGLGYLRLGQPLSTLSGGERQRIKLAIRMSEGEGIYVLDEPTTGLHLADIQAMLELLDSWSRATPSSSSNTRYRSSLTPTGSSTSALGPVMTAARSSSRAPLATGLAPERSPGGIWRHTWAEAYLGPSGRPTRSSRPDGSRRALGPPAGDVGGTPPASPRSCTAPPPAAPTQRPRSAARTRATCWCGSSTGCRS